MDGHKRRRHEHTFENWQDRPSGGRRYWYEVAGRFCGSARYVDEVNADEERVRFHQEIRNESGELIEIHVTYPVDHGHRSISEQ